MKIAHVVGRSRVRYTPARIAAYWGRYTHHEGAAFCMLRGAIRGKTRRYCDPLTPYGYYCCSNMQVRKTFREFIGACDVIHFHDDCYPSMLETKDFRLDGKVLVYHAHIGSVLDRFFKRDVFRYDGRVKHACITNGYGHMFDSRWGRLPDILDLNHPFFVPPRRSDEFWYEKPLRVVYTYSNDREGGKINAKRPNAHLDLLRRIPGVRYIPVSNKSFGEAMAIKKTAHIVLEEIFTPYLHLSALEGAAIGACVVTRYNDYTKTDLCRYLGCTPYEWPFVYADQDSIRKTIFNLRDDRQELKLQADRARDWILRYYGTKNLLRRYLEFYSSAAA